MNLGRNELLSWINHLLQSEYLSIEKLADGIAFSQILDAIHPNSVNVFKLNLIAKYPDDCLRNLKILQSGLKKLKINQPVSFQKMSQGKYSDLIPFLQWLYGYSTKYGIEVLQQYEPFNRRLQILEKQGKSINQMSPHLIPTQAYSYQQQADTSQNENSQQQKLQQIEHQIAQLNNDTKNLEGQLKIQMETNWKLMHSIERSIQQRNTLYLLLKQIQTIVRQSPSSSVGISILSAIQQLSDDFT